MNIIQAKQILLKKLVEQLGGKFAKHGSRPHEAWYYSPFRPDEKTPSFKINELTNRWHDFGHVTSRSKGKGSGGDPIDLWCDYHNKDRRSGTAEALAALENLYDGIPRQRPKQLPQQKPRYEIIQLHKKIFYLNLKEELNRRCLSHGNAGLYLKQAFIRDNKLPLKKINGFAFGNDKDGFEISIPNPYNGSCFKTCIAPKAPTTIEGEDTTRAMVFEGFWDFLTWLEMSKLEKPPCTVYVLNSVSFIGIVAEEIMKQKVTIQRVSLYLDNDEAGLNALHAMAAITEETGIVCADMSQKYKPYKDLNAYWMHSIYMKLNHSK